MNKSIIRYILCRVLQFEGVFLLLPVIVSLIYKEKQGICFLIIAAATFLLGTIGSLIRPKSKVFYAREGFVTVSLSWILLSLVGCLPFVVTKEIPRFVDALFETTSGFTTTGASILSNVEALSYTCQFWRCFTIWVGGMGVLVFIMAILPLSGSHNMHLMKAESTGADVSKLVPKVKDTAKILYLIYLFITVSLITAYMIAGLNLYDALVLAFSTVGTGGFANRNGNLADYSHSVQVIAIVFMIMCGVNFNTYFLIIRKKFKDIFKLEEVGIYLAVIFGTALVVAMQISKKCGGFAEGFHEALFQTASIMTTTGFATVDFNLWPALSKALLVVLTIIGSCAGSTAGGVKVSRVILLRRTLSREIEHLTHPRSVKKLKLNGSVVSEEVVKSVQTFIVAWLVVVASSVLIISLDGFDFTTNLTSVFSMLSNVGPGLSAVGPAGNYAAFSDLSKIVLTFDMIAGRLELFPIFVLFHIGTWRKS